jgi:hypothetical protein
MTIGDLDFGQPAIGAFTQDSASNPDFQDFTNHWWCSISPKTSFSAQLCCAALDQSKPHTIGVWVSLMKRRHNINAHEKAFHARQHDVSKHYDHNLVA